MILLGAMRIFSPSISAAVRIGLLPVVTWRTPLAHMRGIPMIPAAAMSLRT